MAPLNAIDRSGGRAPGTATGHLDSLSGLRAVSVLLVVGGHLVVSGSAPGYLAPILRWADGNLGVRVFFCISGFLITYLLLQEKEATGAIHLRRFYLRRILRIFPAYYAYVAAVILASSETGYSLSACQVFTALTFSKNYACGSWIDGHLWSLAVEEQFYLFWPVVVARCPRGRAVLVALVLIAVAPVSRAAEYTIGHRTFFWLFSNADTLMVGSLAAIGVTRHAPLVERIVRFHPAPMRLAACAAMLVPGELGRNLMLGAPNVLFGALLQAVAATYLIVSFVLVGGGRAHALLNARPVAYVGMLSYSIYLWQQPFLAPPGYHGPVSHWILGWPYNCLSALAVAVLSYQCLERPFLGLRQRYRAVPVGPSATPLAAGGGRSGDRPIPSSR